MIQLKRGLDLPIYGSPEQKIYAGPKVSRVALIGPDYNGMKPSMEVGIGDRVKKGQVVFTCKKRSGVKYTAPGGGVVEAIERGEKRAFLTLIVRLDNPEEEEASISFTPLPQVESASPESIEAALIESGLWTALRTRPYSLCPLPGSRPADIFVRAMDSNPLAADQELIIRQDLPVFHHGLKALARLAKENVYVCTGAGSSLAFSEGQKDRETEKVKFVAFSGPHPAGNAGTHIHFLSPVGEHKTNWTVGGQDVMAIGHLLLHGQLNVERIVSLCGPQVKNPRLLRTRLGADMDELTQDQLKSGPNRIISGSVFHGTKRTDSLHYLTRFGEQISVLRENPNREFLGWHSPGLHKFSTKPIYLSSLKRGQKFHLTTTTHGSRRAMVPIGMYEKIMPLDILPTQLLRALCSRDTENAKHLGALELDEEDLALCTFVDPGKIDYGPILRNNLTLIERDG